MHDPTSDAPHNECAWAPEYFFGLRLHRGCSDGLCQISSQEGVVAAVTSLGVLIYAAVAKSAGHGCEPWKGAAVDGVTPPRSGEIVEQKVPHLVVDPANACGRLHTLEAPIGRVRCLIPLGSCPRWLFQ